MADSALSMPVEETASTSPNPSDQDQPITPDELPPELIAELRLLIRKFSSEEMPNHRQELLKAREGRFFWEGYQYPMLNADRGMFAVPEAGGMPWQPSDGDKRFYYVHNIYTPLGKTLISTLAGTPPPVRFNPCNPLEIADIDAAKEAEKYRTLFYRAVDIGQVLRDVARYAYTDGRVVGWVKKETSGPKFGYETDGTPKTQEIVELFGVLETKVPISLRSQAQFPYLMVSTEKHISELKAKFPDKASKIQDHTVSPGDDQIDRTCRLAVLQGTETATNAGEAYNHLVTEQICWLRNSAFEMVKDETKKATLKAKFPEGCRITYAGETFIEAIPENMDDCLTVFQPMSGDGQAIPALGRFVIPLQKRLNNLTNMVQEKYEKGQPTKFIDSKLVDVEAMTDQIASPEVYMPVKKPAGEPMANFFYKEEEPTVSQDLMGMIAGLKGADSQMVSGAQPALFGGPMQNAKAAAIYSQARDQALGAMSLTFSPLKMFLVRVNEMAALSAETREQESTGGIVPDARGTYQNVSIDLAKLRAGFYKCEAEIDESLPDSPSAQRQTFMQMIQFMGDNPAFQSLIMQPDNQFLFKQLTGIKGFTVPGADQRNVQLREIEQLLKGRAEPPTEQDIQKVAGHMMLQQIAGHPVAQPKPEDMLRPSIEIDPIFDDHNVHFQECQRWMYSDEGQQAKIFQTLGFDNVRLHALEHWRTMQAGLDAGAPMQDNVPDPKKTIAAAQATAGLAQQAGPPEMGAEPGAEEGGPPKAPPKPS